jgi:CheY-like chemotaxis protein
MALKIFVVDDSVTIQKVIELTFEDTDTSIESVTNGDSVLDAILTSRPDVVLADVCMPGINGYEICKQIKHNSDLSHIPVILSVGTFEPFDESEASRVGYDARLTKPFDTFELMDVIRKLVGRNTMPQEKDSEKIVYSEQTAAMNENVGNTRIPVSKQSIDSFLGSNRILDLFDESAVEKMDLKLESFSASFGSADKEDPSLPMSPVLTADQVPEEVLDMIVERVVQKMSADVINEIAWEIVPELSEILIKRSIEENRKP